MYWKRLYLGIRAKERMSRIRKYYQDLLDKCIKHVNSLYMKRYIYRHSYNVLCEKIRVCNTHLQSSVLKDIIQSFDSVIYSCTTGSIRETLECLGAKPLVDTWIETIGVPLVISRERGGIQSPFYRSPAVISTSSTECTRGIWYSTPGRKDFHYSIKIILERDSCGTLLEVFNSKKRMLPDSLQPLFKLLSEKAIITESVAELRSRLSNLVKLRARLGKTPVSKMIQEFISADIPKQVQMLTAMIIKESEDLSHLVTILYDISANHTVVNKRDVPDLIDSLPWEVQRRIRELRRHSSPANTIEETDIPAETRIQMLQVSDSVKKLAMNRLKESNNRGGGGGSMGSDGTSKASSWVDGLLRIPFGIYRKEPVLCSREQALESLNMLLGGESNRIECSVDLYEFLCSQYPELVQISQNCLYWTQEMISATLESISDITALAEELGIPKRSSRRVILSNISTFPMESVYTIIQKYGGIFPEDVTIIMNAIQIWNQHTHTIGKTIDRTREVLDRCVHKQDHAKDQILRVMGQWMVGENCGYCLGFEGPPGIGKTTLAREGIAKILEDSAGKPRPFHMIALGTSATGSSLVGHNYTYHGSTWGDIVRFLMDSQCMNPIIYIDELDKVSRTEGGREIIGILTHLTDPAQNEEFQDRYFSGVNLDLSRVLFIFSYNDPSLIDPILLDRVHRVQFLPLTMTDKVHISVNYTLPQICKTLRLPLEISPDTIQYIAQNYTNEPGIRKLREILFDTFREINLRNLRNPSVIQAPTISFVEDSILRHRPKPHRVKADHEYKTNRVYGMFATNSGMGGILPIKVCSDPFGDKNAIRLTGSLGDVMKESVSVARSVVGRYADTSGAIHIHFPEGATPKDGPSAGCAITLAMYSYYSQKKIPGNVSMTGEIDIDGTVLPVGGIKEKLVGSKAGNIEWVILPEQNRRDYMIACDIIARDEMPGRVEFVNTFEDVLNLIVDASSDL